MITSIISSKGQTTLPKQIRLALNLVPGKLLIYEIENEKVIIKTHPGVAASAGVFKSHIPKAQSWENEREMSRNEWTKHVAGEGLSQ